MASRTSPIVPLEGGPRDDAAVQQPWPKAWTLSSLANRIEAALDTAGFDRAPWLAIGLGAGISGWFVLPNAAAWIGLSGGGVVLALLAAAWWRGRDDRVRLRSAVVSLGLVITLGVAAIWARSAIVGAEPLPYPQIQSLDGRVLEREDQPAQDRVRLTVAYRDADGIARKARVNVPSSQIKIGVAEGARIALRAWLMPPAPPVLPGAYDFARTAWFAGLSATGNLVGPLRVIEPANSGGVLAEAQRTLARHVRKQLGGSEGSIAAAFASGDRGGIADSDEQAMRDSGLTHLLSISGLHVSAVIAGAYFLVMRLFALWPWFALRVRLPLLAAACGAAVGVGYTLLTGGEVPTVRSCIGALLVLGALALGREALSMRMVAAAATIVMLAWPEAVANPGFQMSFAAVLAIVALHGAAPVRAVLAPREEGWAGWAGRRLLMLLVTGIVIELALMPIVLFHFHRAGFYGALANVVAIPLVTFVTMPLIALALVLDLIGIGAPLWWLAGQSLSLLLEVAHFTAGQPGSVKLLPQISRLAFALFVLGGLWLALWQGARLRGWGLAPIAVAGGLIAATPTPDLLVSGDGRHVGIAGEGDRLLVLRDSRSDFARDNLLELAGMAGEPVPLARWGEAQCSRDFCVLTLIRDERPWHILMTRSRSRIEQRALTAACERSDIVIADRWLPRSCAPRWLKADRGTLQETGGLAVFLERQRVDTVSDSQGGHPWWTSRGR